MPSPDPRESGSMLFILLLLALALAPGLFLLMVFYLKDRYERESLSLVGKVFVAGAASIFPAVVLEDLLIGDPSLTGIRNIPQLAYVAYAGVGLPEELVKYLVVMLMAYRSSEFNEPFDGVVYSVSSSLGFATLENVFYVLEGGISVGIARALLAVPSHALDGAVMGIYLGRAKMMGYREGLVKGLIYPALLHGTYDFLLLLDPGIFLLVGIPVMLYALRFVIRGMRRLEDSSPFRVAVDPS